MGITANGDMNYNEADTAVSRSIRNPVINPARRAIKVCENEKANGPVIAAMAEIRSA
jgi:hypothetical protein